LHQNPTTSLAKSGKKFGKMDHKNRGKTTKSSQIALHKVLQKKRERREALQKAFK